jgi:RNA polymerase sigma factor (sigma-70 family)
MARREMFEANSLALLRKDLAKYPILTPAEENQLVKRAKKGNQNARDKLLSASTRYVLKLAWKIRTSTIPLEDLVGQGTLGLLHAYRKYNPKKPASFRTYAWYWIKTYMMRYQLKNEQVVGSALENDYSKLFYNAEKTLWKLRAAGELDGDVDPCELVGKELGIKSHKVRRFLAAKEAVSFDWLLNNQVNGQTTIEQDAVDAIFRKEVRERISQLRLGLSWEEGEILDGRIFLINGNELAKKRELRQKLQISWERFDILEDKVKKKLVECLKGVC